MNIQTISSVFLLLLYSCRPKDAPAKLPNTPESVVRQWQSCIDKNKFEEALQLSTGQAVFYVREVLAGFTEEDTLDVENNILLNLQCTMLGDSAICQYHFEDEVGEKLRGQLALRRVKGQWLVCQTDFDPNSPDSLGRGQENLIFPDDSTDQELE